MNTATTARIIENKAASLTVDLLGGAITSFVLNDTQKINPLSFAFTEDQMPDNNKNGAKFQGHFLCLAHWGPPSEAGMKAGIPYHGYFSNIRWQEGINDTHNLSMHAASEQEGLGIERTIALRQTSVTITEKITNNRPLGRLYNIVQHPTLAAPFLDDTTIINCNGTIGFDQASLQETIHWPYTTAPGYNAVLTFLTDPAAEYGWVTAYSPEYELLIGYVWERKQYPWIHLWQHFDAGKIKYRGLEFGTAAFHQPFKTILQLGTEKFSEATTAFIDVKENIERKYTCFLHKISHVKKVISVDYSEQGITVQFNDNEKTAIITY